MLAKIKHIYNILLIISLCCLNNIYSQGLINNGAKIQLTSGVNIYIDGSNGHYTNQIGGLINNITTGGTLTIVGNWYNNANNVAFNNDGATTTLLGAAQTIGGTNATAFYNLNLLGTNTKSLVVATTTVGGQTTQTGVLSLGARPLDLNGNRLDVTNNSSSAITNSSGYIISETNVAVNPSIVRWVMGTTTGAHVVPFGVAGSLIPLTFNITSAMSTTTSYVDLSTRATSNASNTPWAGASNVPAVSQMNDPILGTDGSVQAVIDRWWNITPSNTVTANVTFSYLGSENTLIAPYQTGNLGAQHWAGSYWDFPIGSAPAVTIGVGAVTANGLSSFSPYVLSSIVAPLPIELLNFEYRCNNNKPILTWCTATENNNHYFSIQHSVDGINYTTIATVLGSGTTLSKTCYQYSISNQVDLSQLNYFKLSQTDFNNISKSYNAIASEPCDALLSNVIIVNDGSKNLGVEINSLIDTNYELTLTNSLGQIMMSYSVIVNKGYNYFPINTFNIANAMYCVSALNHSNEKVTTKKVIISN